MAAILDLPEVRARVSLMSVETYEMLGGAGILDKQVELIRGIVVKKMSKSPLHSQLLKLIFKLFLALEKPGLVAFSERPLRVGNSLPEPDAMLVRGTDNDFANVHPTTAELVVEVAVTSAALDRQNASLYAEANVREYWIVLANERQIEVYRQPLDGIYRQQQTYSVGETLRCESVPDLQIPLADWFA